MLPAILLAPITLCLVAALAGQAASQDGPQETNKSDKVVESLVGKASSINLATILEHQEALEKECAKYHEEKIRQLELLIKYQDANHDQLLLPNPLPVKVPAVCLFLFSQFRQAEPMKPHNFKLDLVNWIYNEDQIRNLHEHPNQQEVNNTARIKRDTLENQENSLLNDYIFNPEANFTSVAENELDSEDMIQFHKDVDGMMASQPYQQMIENNRNRLASRLSPVILVPGLSGSRLQGRMDKKRRVNIFCSKQNDWQDMWISLRQLLPVLVDCWLDNVQLDYDPQSGFSRSPAGVESRVPDFGSVESVRHLDLKSPKLTRYFAPLIERYEKLGYTADVNLLAAPYDFRLAPQELANYFEDLRQLVEQVQYKNSGHQKVTFVCHSMGCTHLLVFLRQQTPQWRQTHVRKMIALSSPWGGCVKALKALVVGEQFDLPLVSEAKMRKLVRTFPSLAYLLPQPEIFARPNNLQAEAGGIVLVETPARKYRVGDILQLLNDIGLQQHALWFQQTTSLIKPLQPLPDLKVDCIHSLNAPTPQTMVFRNQSDFPDGNYELITGEGDGTVNHESLLVCADWAKQMPDKVRHKVIMNTNHNGVIGHKTTLTHITDDVLTH